MSTQIERHRTERGLLLRLLAADGLKPVAFRSLFRMMDRHAFSLSVNGLEFHLRYLEGRGYVELTSARDMEELLEDDDSLSPDQIVLAKLAPDGLSVVNRAVTDLEVSV